MKIRDWVNKNSPLVTGISVVVLAACLYFLFAPPPNHTPHQAYFYDLETGKLYAAGNDSLPPIKTPSGHEMGVRAIIFSCSDCHDESKRFIGYLETLTPEAKEAMQKPPTTNVAMIDPYMMGRQVMDPEKGEWLSIDSPAAGKLVQESMNKCGAGKYPTQCFPDI